jgi:hypothetical protein
VLAEIRIESLGVIRTATVEFDRGLTVLTGETGTGKTMSSPVFTCSAGRVRTPPGFAPAPTGLSSKAASPPPNSADSFRDPAHRHRGS